MKIFELFMLVIFLLCLSIGVTAEYIDHGDCMDTEEIFSSDEPKYDLTDRGVGIRIDSPSTGSDQITKVADRRFPIGLSCMTHVMVPKNSSLQDRVTSKKNRTKYNPFYSVLNATSDTNALNTRLGKMNQAIRYEVLALNRPMQFYKF